MNQGFVRISMSDDVDINMVNTNIKTDLVFTALTSNYYEIKTYVVMYSSNAITPKIMRKRINKLEAIKAI